MIKNLLTQQKVEEENQKIIIYLLIKNLLIQRNTQDKNDKLIDKKHFNPSRKIEEKN